MRIRAVLALLLLACTTTAYADSLAEAARKEAARREKNREAGVKARVITSDEVRTVPPGEWKGIPPGNHATSTRPASGIPDDPDSRKRHEEAWRNMMAEARLRVERARERVAEIDRHHLVPGKRLRTSNGRVNLETLQEMSREAKAELAEAEKELAAVEDEARRLSIPPGWLR